MLRTKLIAVIAGGAALIPLGASAASASTSSVTAVKGIQASSVACTSGSCVIVGLDSTSQFGKTALINPATGAVRVTAGTARAFYFYGAGAACPSKTACVAEAAGTGTEEIATISPKTGAQKITAKMPPPSKQQFNWFNMACPSSSYCLITGNSAAPGVQLPTWGLLVKVSPAGKILQTTVDKKNYGYGPIGCENKSTCLITVEPPLKAGPFLENSRTLVNGKLGKAHNLPGNFFPNATSCYETKLCYEIGYNESGDSQIPEVIPLSPKTGVPGKAIKIPLGSAGPVGPTLQMACYSATQCVAVGEVTKGTGASLTTYAAHVVITSGKPGKAVIDSTKAASSWVSVSCTSGTCYAAGIYFDSSLKYQPTIVGRV